MGAPVAHGDVVAERIDAVKPLQLAAQRPDIHGSRDLHDVALFPDIDGFDILRLADGRVDALGADLRSFRGDLFFTAGDGLRLAEHRRFRCRRRGLCRNYYRLDPFILHVDVASYRNLVLHSHISCRHHPCGHADNRGAQEKDYVEALTREKSLQLLAGAVAAHSLNLRCKNRFTTLFLPVNGEYIHDKINRRDKPSLR